MCVAKKLFPSTPLDFLFQEPWAMGWAIFMAFFYFEGAVEDGWLGMRKRREPCVWSDIKL